MIKRLYFNALSQLSKHYKTKRVAELFLDPPDRILWKKGNLIPMSMPDEQRYVLAIDWAQSVLSESALSELFDGSGAFCYDWPQSAPRSLAKKNVTVSADLGRACAELMAKGIGNVRLCHITQDESHFPFPNFEVDKAYEQACLKACSEKGQMILSQETQSAFGWGLQTQSSLVEIRCSATFRERESAIAANALMNMLKNSAIEPAFMLLKGTFAWAMYFPIEYDVIQKRWALDSHGEEILSIRSLSSTSLIPLSGITPEGFQVVWSQLPDHALNNVHSYWLFEELFQKVVRKLGFEMIGERGSVTKGKPQKLIDARYVNEEWMVNLIKNFPAKANDQSLNIIRNPFPALWSSTWRKMAQKNSQRY